MDELDGFMRSIKKADGFIELNEFVNLLNRL